MKNPSQTQVPQQPTSSQHDSSENQESIRRRAYELYEQRGRTGGNEMQDWLQAESEYQNGRKKAA